MGGRGLGWLVRRRDLCENDIDAASLGLQGGRGGGTRVGSRAARCDSVADCERCVKPALRGADERAAVLDGVVQVWWL